MRIVRVQFAYNYRSQGNFAPTARLFGDPEWPSADSSIDC
jgi:hypothetical protein